MDESATRRKKIDSKLYADLLKIRFTYATNGDEIWAIDMGVKDAQGNYLIPSNEGPVDKLPTLINMKCHSATDAVRILNMQPVQIRDFYLGMQQMLYCG